MTLIRHDGRRGPTWAFRFWSRRRLYQVKGFPSRALAKEAQTRERRRVEGAAWEAQWGPLRPRLTTWDDGLASYEQSKARKKTLAKDLARLAWWRRFFEARGAPYLEAVTPDAVERGLDQLAREARAWRGEPRTPRGLRSPQTLRHYLGVLRHLYARLIRAGQLARNPVTPVAFPAVRPRPVVLPDRAQRAGLLKAATPALRPLVVAAMYTGLRQGAILRLTAEDFTARPGWLRATDEKGGGAYWLPVPQPVRDVLPRDRIGPTPLFGLRRFPAKAWRAARATIGLPTLRFHDLRHLVGVTLSEAGVSEPVIQAFLHHASRQATAIYTRWISDRALLDAAGRLEVALRTPDRTPVRRRAARRRARPTRS